MTSLRLNSLSLQNFRCFDSCEIEFHPTLTVLVAENGKGKTALLDAASLALSAFVNALTPDERLRKIERSDVRLVPIPADGMQPQLPCSFAAAGIVAGKDIRWSSQMAGYGVKARPSASGLKTLQQVAPELRVENSVLPLVAFYGTGRLWAEHRLTEGRRTSVTAITERLAGYADSLTSASSFKGVSAWYEHRVQETRAPAYKESLSTNLALLTAVREATQTVLGPTGWRNLDWDTALGSLVAEHERNGRLPLSSLSDGVRNMLALVADVARRCASLNPHFSGEAARQTPGILLIDEVDMHLHPRWQQLVMELFQQAFPLLQIIASTHSPHVLSTVDKSSIRVIRMNDGKAEIETPSLQTRGVESADVLASVMGVDPVPQLPEAIDLSRYKAMIEDALAETEPARALRSRLIEHFGDKHPVIVDCDRLIRFQAFRLRRDTPSQGS
ncbi:AAA family ATPase [Rhizobium leguminosarum]|uniref:AAA family ATPase n=1 Tax=Rhizobium ruizarguesonis TaxID=2081791 RepID=UPI0013C91069|nr:AAA family ATPase [Rhizobium ruizarguesonis]NEJ60790.1 AAA family ATPase [Rhizobium ruizarguesonis]